MGIARVFRVLYRILIDYCSNCSLAGVGYIANRKYHWTERLFWIGCVLLAWTGSYLLIKTYMELFRKDAVSIVVENLDPRKDITGFPSVGVCEMGYTKQQYDALQQLIDGFRTSEEMEYNYDVEEFMLRLIYHNLYNYGSIKSYCTMYKDCDDCVKCPVDGYPKFSVAVRANCTQLFDECRWNGVVFDCCRFFRVIQTTMGSCFLLNSVQTVNKYSYYWKRMEMSMGSPRGELLLNFSRATTAYVQNEEDIPHMLLTTLQFNQMPEGYAGKIFITVQNIANDPLVRTVGKQVRRCVFPDEGTDSRYDKYSYSVCVTECLKTAQIKTCNCCHHNMLLGRNDRSPVCGYEGLNCLDQKDLMFPQTTIMQPWRTNGLVCDCFPSCTEHEIRIIGRESEMESRSGRSVMIKVMGLPSQRYRRQIVREDIDVVVSIGGILGLFTGASILSLVEFIYFFTVRFASYMVAEIKEEDDAASDGEKEENGSQAKHLQNHIARSV